MRVIGKFLLGLCVAFIVVAAAGIGAFLYVSKDMCQNIIESQAVSPSGDYKAVVFQRDCGATTGFSTHVSIINSADQLGDSAGNIYVAEGQPADIGATVLWAGGGKLVIHTAVAPKISKAENSFGIFSPIKVIYGAVGS